MLSETAGCLSAWFLTLCCQIGCLGSTTRTRAHRAACSLTNVAEVFGRFAETTRLQHVPETIVSCTRFHLPSSSCSDYHHHRYHHALVHVVQRSKGAANTSALGMPTQSINTSDSACCVLCQKCNPSSKCCIQLRDTVLVWALLAQGMNVCNSAPRRKSFCSRLYEVAKSLYIPVFWAGSPLDPTSFSPNPWTHPKCPENATKPKTVTGCKMCRLPTFHQLTQQNNTCLGEANCKLYEYPNISRETTSRTRHETKDQPSV